MAKQKKDQPGLWLFKEEPTHYSFDDLLRDGETVWDGVSNNLARKNLRQVRKGDKVLFYHTGKEKAIIGEMEVTSDPFTEGEDPNAVVVKVKPVRRWAKAVTLEQIKNEESLHDWDLVRLPRLSVMPVTAAQWKKVEALAKEKT